MFDNFSTLCMKGLFFRSIPTGNYMFKISNRNTRTRFEICSDLTIKTPEWRHWRRSGVFIVKIEHISHLILVSLWRTLRGKYRLGCLVAITILDPDIPVENHVCGSLLDSVLDLALKTKTCLYGCPDPGGQATFCGGHKITVLIWFVCFSKSLSALDVWKVIRKKIKKAVFVLAHLCPMQPFSTPWKRQKTCFLGCKEKVHWEQMGSRWVEA